MPALTPERARRLLDLSVALNAIADPDALLRTIIETATDVLDCEAASLLLFDEASGRLRFEAATGEEADALAEIAVPLDASIAGTIFRENRPVLVADADHDERHFKGAAEVTGLHTETLLGVPMRIEGTPVGVLEALNPRAGAFSNADVEALLILSAHAAVAIRNARQRRALRDANERLAQLDHLKSNFMSVASHELRTPLAVILGAADLLRDEAGGPLAAFAGDIVAAGRRMQEIVEAVEEISALQNQERTLDRGPVVLQDVLREAWAEARVGEHPHRITADLPSSPLRITADEGRLRLAFAHLFRNALAFTPPNGTVHLALRSERSEATVSLRDSGRGLAADDLDRIFEPFFQVEDPLTRSRDGLGIGLTLAHALVRLHDGRLWAESDGPGRGSAFHVRLPLL